MLLKRPLRFRPHEPHPLLRRRRLSSYPPPPPPQNPSSDDPQLVSALYSLLTSSPSPSSLSRSLRSLPPLSPSLLDSVLHRARFSHADPARALAFFRLASSLLPSPPSPFAFDTLLYILARSRRFPDCFRLLGHMKRTDPSLISARTVQTVLARVAKVCSLSQTVSDFRRFKKLVHPFDASCFNALLRALCQEKGMDDARSAYHSLKYEFEPNIATFNILLAGWKGVEDAEGFFGEMLELKVKPDAVTYNCLIDVYCKNREIDKARGVFDKMREQEIWPDLISYTSLIGGLGLIGQPDKARDVLSEMREVGCSPDAAAYNAAIRNYCIAKRLRDAFKLMEEMSAKGLSPNATSYNLFFRVYYWANDLSGAWWLYKRMTADGCLPNVQSCMFIVRLARRNERVDMGLELWGDMVEKGFGALRLVSDVLFDLLCDWGKLDEAEKCFMEMVDRGQKPSSVSFKRIRVLMELANRHESIENLSAKMAEFGNSVAIEKDRGSETEREQRLL